MMPGKSFEGDGRGASFASRRIEKLVSDRAMISVTEALASPEEILFWR